MDISSAAAVHTAFGSDWLNCTGDAVVGDTVWWEEAVWPAYKPRGRFRREAPQLIGLRVLVAKIVRESYGAQKQQHTFSLEVLWAVGTQRPETGSVIKRKGRNLYREGLKRLPWNDESECPSDKRIAAQEEKHGRGDAARDDRRARRELEIEFSN